MVKPENVSEHLCRRGASWYFRRKIPTDVSHLYLPKRIVAKSLGQRLTQREANEQARRMAVEWDEAFNRARTTGRPWKPGDPIDALILSSADVARYADAWVHWRLAEDDAVRRRGYTADAFADAVETLRGDLERSKRELALGTVATVEAQLDDFAGEFDLALPADAASRRDLCFALLRAEVKALSAIAARDSGEAIDTPPEPTKAAEKSPATRALRDVLAKWETAKARPAKTVDDATRAVVAFERFTKNPPLASLTREQGADFRAHLLAKAREDRNSDRTARKTLDWVKTLLNFAERDLQWLPRSPWVGLSIDKVKGTRREPWEVEDLSRLFGTELFTAYAIPKPSKACLDAAYWIPLIGAFSGARIAEIAQLRTEDIIRRGSVDCFAFRDDGEGQRLKTDAARREVPIHSELVRLGFLEYVEAIRAGKASQLFPAIPKVTHNSGPGAYPSDWFGDYKTALGFGPEKVFHSFRHTVRTALLEAGVAETTIDRICGHEVQGSEGARTYSRLSIGALAQAVERISYPGLRLARVFTVPAWTPGVKVGRRVI